MSKLNTFLKLSSSRNALIDLIDNLLDVKYIRPQSYKGLVKMAKSASDPEKLEKRILEMYGLDEKINMTSLKKNIDKLYLKWDGVQYKDTLENIAQATNLNKSSINHLIETGTKRVIYDHLGNIDKVDLSEPHSNFHYNSRIGLLSAFSKTPFNMIYHKNLIPNGTYIKTFIKIYFKVKFSAEWEDREMTAQYEGGLDEKEMKEWAYYQVYPFYNKSDGISIEELHPLGTFSHKSFDFIKSGIRESDYLQIFEKGISNFTPKQKDNCLMEYIKSQGSNVLNKELNEYFSEYKTIETLTNFCVRYRIPMVIEDINFNVVSEHVPKTPSKRFNKFHLLIYNNHLYPINGNERTKAQVKPPKIDENSECVYVDDIKKEIMKYINDGIFPPRIFGNEKLHYFYDNGVFYHSNKDFEKCKSIISAFNLAVGTNIKCDLDTTFFNISYQIEKYYSEKIDTKSVWIGHESFAKGGYLYKNDKVIMSETCQTIDMNKGYTKALYQLPYLLVVDSKTCEHVIWTDDMEINDDWLYIVRCEKTGILLPYQCNAYDGAYLKYCRANGFNFRILEGISCRREANYFRKLIDDMERIITDKADFKKFMNIMIGKFESKTGYKTSYTFEKIVNAEEKATSSAFFTEISDEYYMQYSASQTNFIIHNRKPIAFQVKDMMRRMVYEKLNEMELTDADVIQIHNDSITANLRSVGYHIQNMGSGIGQWKYENYNEMAGEPGSYYTESGFNLSFKMEVPNQANNQLHLGNAGCGKSTAIKALISGLNGNGGGKEAELLNYVILTPTHNAKNEYIELGLNAKVIQTYDYCGFPTEQNIIIDEIGLCGGISINTIIKCAVAGKNVYAYGDFSQLLPVGESNELNGNVWIDCVFGIKTFSDANYRNHFTAEYYESVKTGDIHNAIEQISKNQTNEKDAEIILCYHRNTRDLYNQKKMESLGMNMYSIGCKVICTTNSLSDAGIYNNYKGVVTLVSKEYVVIDKIIVSKKIYESCFRPAYCITAYGIQGSQVKSYHFAQEDLHRVTSRMAYTIISRLRTKF